MDGKKKVGSPRRSRMKDILQWIDWNNKNNTGEKGTYEMVKRIAENRNRWKLIVVNLRDDGYDN